MKILIACEESQTVCGVMRERGHEAYSADVQEPSGNHPEWHILGDVLPLINGNCQFRTMDGKLHKITGKWDLLIAHPPCTYLTTAGTRHFSPKCNPPEKIVEREKLRESAAAFFLKFANADCEKIAIENPVGYMSKHYKKPTQIIEPYFFAESTKDSENYVTKRTCLWLKGLPPLKRTNDLPRPKPLRSYVTKSGKIKNVDWEMTVSAKTQKERAKLRSKTFPGIAKAMAEQWTIKQKPNPNSLQITLFDNMFSAPFLS